MVKILGISTPSAFKRAKSRVDTRQSTPVTLSAMLLYEAGWALPKPEDDAVDPHSFSTTNQIFSHLFDALPFATVSVKSTEYRTQSVAIDRRYEYSDIEDRFVLIEFSCYIRLLLDPDFVRKKIECSILPLDKESHPWKYYQFRFNIDFRQVDDFVALLSQLNDSFDKISEENDRLIAEEQKAGKKKETISSTNEAVINAKAAELGLELNYYETSKLKYRYVVFHLKHNVRPRFRIDNASPQVITKFLEIVANLAQALDACPKDITFLNCK